MGRHVLWQLRELFTFFSAVYCRFFSNREHVIFIHLKFFIYLLFWLRWVFVAAHGLPLVAASISCCRLWCVGFSLWAFSMQRMGSGLSGLQELQLLALVAVAHGFVAPWHVESSWTRDRASVPCIGGWTLNHWTTREVWPLLFLYVEHKENKMS